MRQDKRNISFARSTLGEMGMESDECPDDSCPGRESGGIRPDP